MHFDMRVKKIYCREMTSVRFLAPWAIKTLKIPHGFLVFESLSDFNIWMRNR